MKHAASNSNAGQSAGALRNAALVLVGFGCLGAGTATSIVVCMNHAQADALQRAARDNSDLRVLIDQVDARVLQRELELRAAARLRVAGLLLDDDEALDSALTLEVASALHGHDLPAVGEVAP